MSTKFDKPSWATGGAASISAPTAAKQALGFVSREKPGRGLVNWLFNRIGQGLANLIDGAITYDDLDDFISSAEPGDTGIVKATPDLAFRQLYTASQAVKSVDGDGEKLATIVGTAFQLRTAATPTTVDATFTPTNAVTTARRALTNGTHVLIAHDQYIELFDRDTQASLWTFDHGAAVTDIALDGQRAYLVGVTSSSKTIRAINITTGSEQWSVDCDAGWNAIATDGKQVYAGGNGSSGGGDLSAGSTFAIFNAALGTLVSEDNTAGTVANARAIATDGAVTLVCGTSKLAAYSATGGGLGETTDTPDGVMLSTSHAVFWASGDVLIVERPFSVADGSLASPHYAAAGTVDDVYTDGARLWVACSGATSFKERVLPGRLTRLWYRSSGLEEFSPSRQLAYPLR